MSYNKVWTEPSVPRKKRAKTIVGSPCTNGLPCFVLNIDGGEVRDDNDWTDALKITVAISAKHQNLFQSLSRQEVKRKSDMFKKMRKIQKKTPEPYFSQSNNPDYPDGSECFETFVNNPVIPIDDAYDVALKNFRDKLAENQIVDGPSADESWLDYLKINDSAEERNPITDAKRGELAFVMKFTLNGSWIKHHPESSGHFDKDVPVDIFDRANKKVFGHLKASQFKSLIIPSDASKVDLSKRRSGVLIHSSPGRMFNNIFISFSEEILLDQAFSKSLRDSIYSPYDKENRDLIESQNDDSMNIPF